MWAMEEYPRTLIEFEKQFTTEEQCHDYLFHIRWPEGFHCPRCGGVKAWPCEGTLFKCSSCTYKVSIIVGTIFQGTHLPLGIWFRAIWWIVSQKSGASALNLQKILGLGSYKTAWSLLHKLRRAMVRPGRESLSGVIEVDETYIGGMEEGVRGRETEKKSLVVIAAEEDGTGIGRIRMKQVKNVASESLHTFVEEAIEPGSTLHTDGWEGYSGIGKKGYRHKVTVIRKRKESASTLLPRVHRVASLLKRWLMGTHQGAVRHQHLEYYLDEFTFRFNRRTSRDRGKLFYRLLQQSVLIEATSFKNMISDQGRSKSK